MPQHGFARDNSFRVLETTERSVRMCLESGPGTLRSYPFRFKLEVEWQIADSGLAVRFGLSNSGPEPMPASLGWHPAFAWDSAPGWGISFSRAENSSIRRVNAHVNLLEEPEPSPVRDQSLPLTEDLFGRGALIFAEPRSRTVTYSSSRGPLFDLDMPGFPQFTVWKYPGADFVCLEPWHGLPSPAGFDDEFSSMPHQMLLQPAESRDFRCLLTPWPEA
jgi:galactose mutarotase-like enzyme